MADTRHVGNNPTEKPLLERALSLIDLRGQFTLITFDSRKRL